MLKRISNHKMVFTCLIFAILFIPITYNEAANDGIYGYERIFMCICTVLCSAFMGHVCDMALKNSGTKND